MKTVCAFFTLIVALFSSSSWAVDCYQNAKDGPVNYSIPLPPFTVPNDAVLGTKIWESPDINITVYCDNAPGWKKNDQTEDIFAWIKLPDFNSTEVLNNPYFTFGVTYNGTDHEMINEGIDTGVCLDKFEQYYQGFYYDPVCNGVSLQKGMSFNARFRLYVKLKAIPPSGSPDSYNFGDINVLQFDGEGGANTTPNAKNLRFYITGLDNIHFLDCSVDIKISPESQVVDFEQIYANSIAKGPTQRAFSISSVKDETAGCSEQFDVTTSFYTNDTLYDTTHLDMGNGLLLRITDTSDNNRDVEYNQYRLFATYVPGDPAAVTHNYIAELTKHPSKSLVDGPFSKDLIIKINYQ
ncbi:TPA: pilus assembly protein [Kluyvera ascorbata]|uniref:Pilus assembly protein n=1 Tax=Kluyvera genomosp. 2 TaxID=2774054 RepID=A0A2T2Y0S9_9ENTR|nr:MULTISPECIES: pilus assembly protein [Enterobacteriaceae]HAT3919010.1 pilus assembly protein [Kluyvera ascorbata]PSR46097.1 pilus assembly protein [Kluyvera genomosp. 2]BBQ83520.1 pilus protein [Klebsiella sp. WP3-W18-ESBL-02]BBR20543.1 pilus protein [Klebsiella sp. WP3-S18-ESBL-05]HAT3943923.1 pilus assembly protein [Kluyvera ascorbata]